VNSSLEPKKDNRIEVAIAILYQDDKFLMQLRDNIPTILYPGYWALFGGHIELGETPEIAVQREILEEIGYTLPSNFSFFDIYSDERVIRHVFYAPLEVEFSELVLSEGWDMGLLSFSEIQQGKFYSPIANETRPLGPVHQGILSDFIKSK
jgi:8-oxo-dGTP diphosphatase